MAIQTPFMAHAVSELLHNSSSTNISEQEVERRNTVGILGIVFLMKRSRNDLQLHMRIELTAAMLTAAMLF